MIEKNFDFNKLYGRIVKYYLEQKHYTKEKANFIAQKVVLKEKRVRTCQNTGCGHLLYDHLRNYESCLIDKCGCRKFVKTA
jgi:predicted RNA-binding Zn ribbon-like protein